MATRTVKIITCDHCRTPIEFPGRIVEIGYYGLTFHTRCFISITGPEMVRLVGCDETLVRTVDKDGKTQEPSKRVRDPRNINDAGDVPTGKFENVTW